MSAFSVEFYHANKSLGVFQLSHVPRQMDHIVIEKVHYVILAVFLFPEKDDIRIVLQRSVGSPRFPGEGEVGTKAIKPSIRKKKL